MDRIAVAGSLLEFLSERQDQVMQIEIWRDADGYRLLFEDNEFDLTVEAFGKLVESLAASYAMDEEGDYRQLCLDLAEDEDGRL
jgi:hypothetical protein